MTQNITLVRVNFTRVLSVLNNSLSVKSDLCVSSDINDEEQNT